MRITYVKLENVEGLYVGSNRRSIEIDFKNSINKIIAIRGLNGAGKTVLLSSLTPFAHCSNIDERSSLPYISLHKNGYKEIHYALDKDVYVIKHYFKANKNTHSIKSYISKNGEELNENGNVTSFISLVEIHLGITPDMMRLSRIGTNVDSFISLSPAKRKEYIGKLIDEIETYLKIYKKINDDIKVVRTMLQANNTNLYNCHISDILVEEESLKKLQKDIKKHEKERDSLISQIAKITSLMKDNDINELRRKKNEAESSLMEFERISKEISDNALEHTTLEDLIKERNELSENKIDIKSKINSLRLNIDSLLKNIERLELMIKKITSNHDVQSLLTVIASLRESVSSTSEFIKKFTPLGSKSEEVQALLSDLQSYNQISKMILTLGNQPLDIYIQLRNENRDVDRWLKEQARKSVNMLSESDLKILFDQVFQDDDIITPNCEDEFNECPYYRFHELITATKKKLDEESYSDETLRYVEIIFNNISTVLNGIDRNRNIQIPDKVRNQLSEKNMIERLGSRMTFFDLSDLQEYLSILKDYEIYSFNSRKLSEYEKQLSVYQQAGIESHVQEIDRLKLQISEYRDSIKVLEVEIMSIDKKLESVDSNIALVTQYNDSKKYQKMFKSTLETTDKILQPLESAEAEKMKLEFSLSNTTNLILSMREQYKNQENKINEYHRLVKEGKKLSKQNSDLNIILDAVSTKKGIPVYYMKRYLTRIQKLSNELLSLIYDDTFALGRFNVTPDTFEVPYIKNGRKIPDIKYASQSEVALATMALSFALANNASGKYNILLLDEIDSGLDDRNRSAFLKMLYMQMNALRSEQVFIISHNLSQMTNIPMDCIDITEVSGTSKLQNIIYQ